MTIKEIIKLLRHLTHYTHDEIVIKLQMAIESLEQLEQSCVYVKDLSAEDLNYFAEEMKKVRPQVLEQESCEDAISRKAFDKTLIEMLDLKREDKQAFCNALCRLLRMTRNLGDPINNALAELRYVVDEHGNEYVVPVFEDGAGEPDERNSHGYYAVGVSGDNCMGILADVFNGFIKYY